MARPYPSDTILPEGEVEIRELKPKVFSVLFTPPIEAMRAPSLNPKDYTKRILDINFDTQTLVIYPYQVWGLRSMQPRYITLSTITVETSFKNAKAPIEDDIAGIIASLPSAFTQDYNYGLGFRKEYRHIVRLLEEADIEHLYINQFGRTSINLEEKEAVLSKWDLFTITEALDKITEKARRVARAIKDKTVNEMFSGLILQQPAVKNNINLKEEISNLLGGTKRFSPGGATKKEEEDAIEVIRKNSPKILKDHPGELLKLRNDIETVTLSELIRKFEGMLEKDLRESHWQRMFEENPFIINMAFGTPLVKIQGQAYIGGRRITGAGEKIADFLFKNSTTKNATIVEIKKPGSKLLAAKAYRGNLFAPSSEMVSAVNQVLDQIYHFEKSIAHIKEDSKIPDMETYSVFGVLIIGRSFTDTDQQKSFELYRGNSKNIQIVTFDELLEKLKMLLQFLNPKSTSEPEWVTLADNDRDEDGELPF